MHATVIDTLRYADRLKEAGLDPSQAEAMSRALNDELTEGLVTRIDLDDAVALLKGDIGHLDETVAQAKGDIDHLGARMDTLEATVDAGFKAVDKRFDAMDAKFDAKLVAVDARIDAMDGKFESRFEAMGGKFESKFEAMDGKFESKFEAMDGKFEAKFEAIDAKFRYVFLVLALIVGLGLYNATAPHVLGMLRGDSQRAEPDRAADPAQAATDDAESRTPRKLGSTTKLAREA